MDHPVLFKEKTECCGCTACYAICPKGAISMVPDDEGFEYPQIDYSKCVLCYRCISVCPFKTNAVDEASCGRPLVETAKSDYNISTPDDR